METILTQPSATPVIQALRAIGYNSKTATADLLDNSIDAKATEIRLFFEMNGKEGSIIIKDNGKGMNDKELQVAMNIGSKDPRASRTHRELGRFGMGLKTASFSLGKRLSVLTKQNGIYYERCWDLDYVSQSNEWQLFKKIPAVVREKLGDIEGESGTIVCVDKLDRFLGATTENTIQESSFLKKVKRIHHHLSFFFHSIIEEEKVKIYLNNILINPWDPFFRSHSFTIEGENIVLRLNKYNIKVKSYILPHASHLNEQEYKIAGGERGWRDQQGFYIYRENRLLYAGDWLGMFPKEVSSQLARIRIDIPNIADEDWQVDIKKSVAIPPDQAKKRLYSIADLARKISKDIFYFRTHGNMGSSKFKGSLNTWELAGLDSGIQYILNRNHPILTEVLNRVDGETSKLLNLYLRFVQLGSPSNIIETTKVAENTIQYVSDFHKNILIQFARTMIELKVVRSEKELLNALSTQPAFDGINHATMKNIIEGVDINYED